MYVSTDYYPAEPFYVKISLRGLKDELKHHREMISAMILVTTKSDEVSLAGIKKIDYSPFLNFKLVIKKV